MPDIIVTCPQCERPLRVPENLIGRLVKCPACGLTFSVPAGADPQPLSPARREPEPPISRHHPADEAHASAQEERAPRGDGLESGESERERARSSIMPPAVLLLLTGVLGLLADLVQIVWVANNTRFPPPPRAQAPQNLADLLREGATGPAPIIIGAVFAFVSILVILAAVQMLRLRSYGFAVTGTVLAMVNFGNLCCVLGLPLGIWALVMLSRPEVKSAFQTRSPPAAGEPMSGASPM